MQCQTCFHEVSEDAEFCPSCTTPLVQTPLDQTSAEPPGVVGALDHASAIAVRSGKSASRFPSGTLLADRYRIVSRLGRGGMGEVYRADDLKLGQQVALKLLPAGLEQDEGRLARLLEEVALARRISHPGVCRVYDIGDSDGLHFLSMEYIDGEDLASLLRRVGRLAEDRAIEIGVEICRGLAASHGQGVLHRDLKPSNLMIDRRGRARIADFGLASLTGRKAAQDVGRGTPAYMAPELLSGQPASVASDLYALGLVLYKLFTGRPAFQVESPADYPHMHLEVAPTPPSRLVSTLEPAIEQVILRCLAKAPAERPESALAVAEMLRAEAEMPAGSSVVKVLVYGQLEGHLSDDQRSKHDQLVRDLAQRHHGERLVGEHLGGEKLGSEWDLRLMLDRPIRAIRLALKYHRALDQWSQQAGIPVAGRVAIHLGEMHVVRDPVSKSHGLQVEPASRAVAEHLVALAGAGQTLLTQGVFDLARQNAPSEDDAVRWLAHGSYEIEGVTEPLPIFEAGLDGVAPLTPPIGTTTARRRIVQTVVPGWRPASGLELPQRPHWQVERQLGEGGFGEVWLAVHGKTQERRVFKFCYDAERLRALQREITIFRLLKEALGERDDITRIYDWNFDQPPYFIEAAYTAGGSLVDWAIEQGGLANVALETRLEIVAQVASALAAAHSVGVLHKDVKPQNVLITTTEDGQVRAQLSDFGVGLLTERERLADAGITAMGMTEAMEPTKMSSGAQLGTRLYTAPELLEGKPATLQADIYALGVTLYQAVVGDFHRALAPGWERQIEDELLRLDIAAAVDGTPKRRLGDASRLAQQLRGLAERRQTLAAEGQERAEALATKLALRKAKQRRKLFALAMVGMMVVTLVAGMLIVQARHIAHQAEATQEVSDFLIDLFQVPDPYQNRGDQITAREILDRGAEKIGNSLDRQPATQAELMQLMGTVYRNLGLNDRARPMLEKALEIRQQLHGDDHPEVVASLNAVAEALNGDGQYQEAENLGRRALEMGGRIGDGRDLATADSLDVIAESLFNRGEYADAEKFYGDALDIRQAILGESHAAIAAGLRRVGASLMAQRRLQEAEPLYRRSLVIYRELYGNQHPDVAFALQNIAILLHRKGDATAAIEQFRESVAMFRQTLGSEHPSVASGLSHLAYLLQAQGRLDEAKNYYDQALSIYDKLGEPTISTAGILLRLADLHMTRSDFVAAKDLSQQALEVNRQLLKGDHFRIAESLAALGSAHAALAEYRLAEEYFVESLEMHQRLLDEDDFDVFTTKQKLGETWLAQGFFAKAEPMLRDSLIGQRTEWQAGHWRIASSASSLGQCLVGLGHLDEAEELLLQAYEDLQILEGAEVEKERQATLQRLSKLYLTTGDTAKASSYRRLLADK